MFYGNNVQDTRQLFFDSWAKYKTKKPLLPLESEIVEVIRVHPEYHAMLEQPEKLKEKHYFPETGESNPFLHMGLHLAIREQLATDRPLGIAAVYQKLLVKIKDPLAVEHLMMDQLAECLWLAQRHHQTPDEQLYLNRLNALTIC